MHIKGPEGGKYIIFEAEDTDDLLVRNKESSRSYATYVKDLRKVGRWEKESENSWRHSDSGRKIELEKNSAGYWTIDTDLEFEAPKYGFSDREYVEEEVNKLIQDNPEG